MKQRTAFMARTILCAILFALFPALAAAEDASAPTPAEKNQPAQAEASKPAPAEKPAAPASPQKEAVKKEEPPKKPAPKPQKEQPKPAEKKPQPKPAAEPKWKSLIEKKHENFFQWLETNYPQKAQELKNIGEKQPDKFVQRMTAIMEIYEPIQKEEKRNPELAKLLQKDIELQDQRDQLLKKLRSAKETQRQSLQDELKEVVAARFDVIIAKKQNEYNLIRKRLDWLNKKLEKHGNELQKLKDEKDQSVDKRMKDLIEGKVDINWK